MAIIFNILIPTLVAYGCWRWVELTGLSLTISQLTSALSIFIAAVLVRLARGMPTLDWKSVPLKSRKHLTGQLLSVSREYAGLLGILLVLLVSVVLVGAASPWILVQEEWLQRGVSAAMGFMVALSILRFGYVVWRDLDIVSLQKAVIDGMAAQEEAQEKSSIAATKLENMRGANLSGGEQPKVETWEEGHKPSP